jgi:hypothetical protein
MNVRQIIAALAVLAILPGSSSARLAPRYEQSELVAEARGLKCVRVENVRGRIRVVPSPDGRIHLTALKVIRGATLRRSDDLADRTRVETSTAGGRFLVRVRYPQGQVVHVSLLRFLKGGFNVPGIEVRLVLEMPPALALELESASGDFETADLTGPQRLETTSGDVEVRGAASAISIGTTSGDVSVSGLGRARVRSVSGDVTVQGVRGPLVVSTTSGGIQVSDAADSLALSSISGDIELDRAPRGLDVGSTSGTVRVTGPAEGSVHVRSTSGDVELQLGRAIRRVEVNTVSGEVGVRLADGQSCDLALRSTSGTLDASVPIRIRTMTRHELYGTVSGGGVPVSLHSVSGDITVSGEGR